MKEMINVDCKQMFDHCYGLMNKEMRADIERAGKPNVVLGKFSEIEDFIVKIEETLNHNLKLGYIKEETNVVELLEFFKEMKNNYLPFQREIVKFIEANQNK